MRPKKPLDDRTHESADEETRTERADPARQMPDDRIRGKAMWTTALPVGAIGTIALVMTVGLLGGNYATLRSWYMICRLSYGASSTDRSGMVEDIVAIGKPAVPSLIVALRSGNGSTREYAAMALGEIGDRRATRPLIGALGDASDSVRAQAAMALAKHPDLQAVRPLVELLRSNESRDVAVSALMFHGTMAVPTLLDALGDSDQNMRAAAYSALVEIATEGKFGEVQSPFDFSPTDVEEVRNVQIGKMRRFFRCREPATLKGVREPQTCPRNAPG